MGVRGKSVVVTGLGATTPLGGDVVSTWGALLEGRSGVGRIPAPWARELPSQIAAFVRVEPAVTPARAFGMDRATRFALISALEAWRDAGFSEAPVTSGVDPHRLAVCMGTGMGGLYSLLKSWEVFGNRGLRHVGQSAVVDAMPNSAAAQVGLMVGAQAGTFTRMSACASGSEAVALGVELIRLGRADVVVVGGTDAIIHPGTMAAFDQMQALSRRNAEPQQASRPWDHARDGFVVGEGSASLVVESLEHAKGRRARIYGTISGLGMSFDSHNIVQPDASGAGQSAAMQRAISDADLAPHDISHVNAHATSTPLGDTAEATSIRRSLGRAATECIVTANKSMTGHLFGGSGALEAVVTVLTLYNRRIPPTVNLESPEPGLGIEIATRVRALPDGNLAALTNSFGFGGHNISLVLTNSEITSVA